ncbi:hypothetical protein VpaJT1_11 [Vibrio phage VpaJT_1]|nr:hypothetical protein VpaJT1_11 [Vibrio phage VpaJT_1]
MLDKILRKLGYVPKKEERDRIVKLLDDMPQLDCGCCNTGLMDWEDVVCESALDTAEANDVLTYPPHDFELSVTSVDSRYIYVTDEVGFKTKIEKYSGYVSPWHKTDRAGWSRC